MGAAHNHRARRVHGLGQGRNVQCLAIKRREERRNANDVSIGLPDGLTNPLPWQAIVPIMTEQFKRAQVAGLVIALKIGKFWGHLQDVLMHGSLAIENLDVNASAAKKSSQEK